MLKIIAIVGSLRKLSFNLQLAKTMQARYRERMAITVADIGMLPHFDQDEELDPPATVKQFKHAVAQADGVLIITPEYNWSVPGVLKNALDWASRVDRVLVGKPVLPLGVSPGMMGTLRAQLHLREILAAPGLQAKTLPPGGNEVLINFAAQKFDEATGRLVDEMTLNFLDGVVEKFIALIEASRPAASR